MTDSKKCYNLPNYIKKELIKNPFYILFIPILLIALDTVSGQFEERTYSFKNYSNEEGFDQNTVIAIEQDKYGMFWLGTSNGLIKYDGISFYNVSWEPENQDNIYHGKINEILADEEGLLWILSVNGLNVYYPTLERFYKIPTDSKSNKTGLQKDNSGSVWIFGNGYLASIKSRMKEDSVITHWTPNVLTGTHAGTLINDLLWVNEDLCLIATQTGILKMNLTDWRVVLWL